MTRRLIIDGKEISDETDAWVVAEIGHNHQGDVDKAKELFLRAKECGVNAVKLQKRENRTLYTAAMYYRPYDNENSFGPTYGAHREALEFGRDEYVELQRHARELGLTFFATAFDFPSVDFLAELGAPALKIASADLRTTPLLQYAARVGVPIMLSTGAADLEDVQRALDAILPINAAVCVMQCTAVYPAEFNELDLGVITTFRRLFPDLVVGYSGHDNGIAMPIIAYTLGARVIEKHFTLNRAMKGTDHAFSLEPVGMRKMVRDLRRARVAMGDGVKKLYPSEQPARSKMGKTIVAARDLPAGSTLQADDLALKSPGDGLPPYRLGELVGRVLREPLMADDVILFDLLEEPARRPEAALRTARDEGTA
jgi:N-acetylneuraminate synthase/sialic acid synthase